LPHFCPSFSCSAPSPYAPRRRNRFTTAAEAYAIATVVDTFIDKLLVNDTLNANPRSTKRERACQSRAEVPRHRLVCQSRAARRLQRPLDESAHRHLNITEQEWNAMVGDFVAVLDQYKVPKPSRPSCWRSSAHEGRHRRGAKTIRERGSRAGEIPTVESRCGGLMALREKSSLLIADISGYRLHAREREVARAQPHHHR
jgi:hemoglobin